ncbi:hypothetical protein BaRGS_00014192 [Batillaria attramentaria]|uniref:Phosphagen kinase N-terminal domain-containing protein n=1 Tax=Batillaria attramentaria TaxID=370345 RepID=A0ABD0L552_9CAEN
MATDLEELYKTLSEAESCKSLLKKHLTKEVFDALKERRTSLGGTLADCIRSGKEIKHRHFLKCKLLRQRMGARRSS